MDVSVLVSVINSSSYLFILKEKMQSSLYDQIAKKFGPYKEIKNINIDDPKEIITIDRQKLKSAISDNGYYLTPEYLNKEFSSQKNNKVNTDKVIVSGAAALAGSAVTAIGTGILAATIGTPLLGTLAIGAAAAGIFSCIKHKDKKDE